MRPFQTFRSSLPDVARLVDALKRYLDPLTALAILDGQLLTSVSIGTSNTEVSHGLGRAPRGWLVVRRRANATVWDTQDSNTGRPDKTLWLQASSAVVVDLWVF